MEQPKQPKVKIVRAIQTCSACPSQWDAWDSEGNYWYLRFRHGHGTAERQPSSDIHSWEGKPPEFEFATGEALDGVIDLPDFCMRAGMELALG